MNRAYKIAVACGAAPLVVGTSIFLLWLATRWDWLMLAGIFTIYGGVVVFLVGAVSLVYYGWRAFRSAEVSRRRAWLSTLLAGGLLLANFPAAAGIFVTAMAIETSYTVVVYNASQQPLEHVLVFGGGCDVDFGTIAPGETASRRFWIKQDGELDFGAQSGPTIHAQRIEGYVTNGMGGHTTVTVHPDGKISVTGTGVPD